MFFACVFLTLHSTEQKLEHNRLPTKLHLFHMNEPYRFNLITYNLPCIGPGIDTPINYYYPIAISFEYLSYTHPIGERSIFAQANCCWPKYLGSISVICDMRLLAKLECTYQICFLSSI